MVRRQGPAPEDARKDGHIRGRSKLFMKHQVEAGWTIRVPMQTVVLVSNGGFAPVPPMLFTLQLTLPFLVTSCCLTRFPGVSPLYMLAA